MENIEMHLEPSTESATVPSYLDASKYFYSESLELLIKPLGQKNDWGYTFIVIYSDNPSYTMPAFEAVPEFLNNYFVECKYDPELNEISYLSKES